MIAKTTSKSTKLFLGVAWVLQLVFAVILIAPTLVLGVRSTSLDGGDNWFLAMGVGYHGSWGG